VATCDSSWLQVRDLEVRMASLMREHDKAEVEKSELKAELKASRWAGTGTQPSASAGDQDVLQGTVDSIKVQLQKQQEAPFPCPDRRLNDVCC
jgi:hypothetical protein